MSVPIGDIELSERGLGTPVLSASTPDCRKDDDEKDLGTSTCLSSDEESDGSGLAWSLSSNFLFFLGSVIYMFLAIWDLGYARYESVVTASPSPTPVSSVSYDDDGYDSGWDPYTLLSVVAAVSFVFCSAVDMLWYLYGENARTAMAVAVAFGAAALCELLAVYLYENDRPILEGRAYIASSHVYLISAVLQVRHRWPSFETISDAMEGSGDALFLLGSIIDAVLSYLNDPEMSHLNLLVLARWNLVSAVLWLVDSVLYILSDFLSHSLCWKSRLCVFWWSEEVRIARLAEGSTKGKEPYSLYLEIDTGEDTKSGVGDSSL